MILGGRIQGAMPEGLPKKRAGMPQRKDLRDMGSAREEKTGAAREEQRAVCFPAYELGAAQGERESMKGDDAMAESTYETLCEIREKVLELTRMQDSVSRLEAVYKSPSFDGMPGGGSVDAMGRRMCALEEMAERETSLEDEVQDLLESIKPAIRGLPNHLHTFCVTYYLAARSIRDVCMVMQRAKPTVLRYKDELREALG